MSGEQNPQPNPAPNPAPAGGDWLAGVEPDVAAWVKTKGYAAPADVVKGAYNMEKIVGVDRIPLPKDGVWDDFSREKLGIPKDPAGYKLQKPTLPEGVAWDENFEKAAIPVLHKLGLTPQQANGLLEFYASHQGATHKQIMEAKAAEDQKSVAAREEALTALKSEFGQAFDERLGLAKRALAHFGGEGLAKMAAENPAIGNNPDLIRAFAKIGAMMGEDPLKTGKATGGAMTPAEALAEANKLMQNPGYTTHGHPEHDGLVKRVNELFAMAHDNERDVRYGGGNTVRIG